MRHALTMTMGTAWDENLPYTGGATAVIATLVSRGTGRPLQDYARERLFAPLGIVDLEWITDRAGEPIAASGLRLRPRDLARIGQLLLNRGRWNGREIVPAAWLDEAATPRVGVDAIVVTAGNYNQPENWRTPIAVLGQFVLPALAAGPPG